MQIRDLAVDGAFEITPSQHTDERGLFLEWFRHDRFLETVGHRFPLAQANCSVSSAGVVRGIHFAEVPPGQAKYVTCTRGAVFDVAVDLRVGSATFGAWDGVVLDETARRAVYLAEGLGHAFMALEDDATVVYLCSTPYNPEGEHGVHPLDPDLAIDWPNSSPNGLPLKWRLSDKDAEAPSLAECRAAGLLPRANDMPELPEDGGTSD